VGWNQRRLEVADMTKLTKETERKQTAKIVLKPMWF
jgi:hypothetical protein